MDRIIKFRVWNKKEKTFKCSFTILDVGNIKRNNKFSLETKEECVIQQSTGLHDNKNNEIYEGDILQEQLFKGEFREYVVEWGNDGWYLVLITPDWDIKKAINLPPEEQPRITYFYNGMKIIGNIFENPELLKSC